MRALSRVGLLLTVVANLSACTGVSGSWQGRSTPADTVVLGVQSEPDTLNPILGYAPDGASKLFDGLVARDTQLRLVPALAEALPEVSNDGRTYTFRLRQGVRFHDGQPLVADDVVFTYQAILAPTTATALRRDLDMITAVTAPDERTVVFRLAYPYAPFVQRTTVGIVPRHAFTGQGAGGNPPTSQGAGGNPPTSQGAGGNPPTSQGAGSSPPAGQNINTAQFNTAPIGTGPFVFEEWKPGDRLILRANPDYWGGRPVIARLVLAFVPDDHIRATRMERGDFDATHLLPKAAARFRNREGITVYDMPAADYRGVMFPLNHPITGDVTIRRALSQAIDRDALVKGILDGTGKPAYGPISPDTNWFNPAVIPTDPADRDAANMMLYEAGWIMGADGVRVHGNQPARFTLMYPTNDSLGKDLALAVAATGAQIGVDIQVEGLDWDAIEPRMANDALLMGWGTPYDPDFTNYRLFHSQFAGQGFFNPGYLRDAEIDRLLNDARRTADPGVRKAAYHAVQARLVDQAVWAWLVYLEHVYVVRDRFDGIEVQIDPHAYGTTHGIWWNIERWQPRG